MSSKPPSRTRNPAGCRARSAEPDEVRDAGGGADPQAQHGVDGARIMLGCALSCVRVLVGFGSHMRCSHNTRFHVPHIDTIGST